MYNTKVSNTKVTALFDSGATLSCISKQFYDCICQAEPAMVIDTNARPPVVIMSASVDELTNLGQCRLHFKLGPKTFEYYFQIIKNLKQDCIILYKDYIILCLNFQRTFKILQGITDDNNLYSHIRKKIVTFSQQAKNTTNHINTCDCTQLKPKSFKQFKVKVPKGLKSGAVYEIDYNAKGIPDNVIPVLDTFITRKHQKSIGITLINQSPGRSGFHKVRSILSREEQCLKRKHRRSSTS